MAALCDEALYTKNTVVLDIGPYLVSERYGKPFYYLLSRIYILYIISDILYRIKDIYYRI